MDMVVEELEYENSDRDTEKIFQRKSIWQMKTAIQTYKDDGIIGGVVQCIQVYGTETKYNDCRSRYLV